MSALVITVMLLPASPAGAALPDMLSHVGDARQLIVVTGQSWTSTQATVRAYRKGPDDRWREVLTAVPARIGYGGWKWAADRRQDTGQTPAGTFTLTEAFGVRADPGARLPYRKVDGNDYWAGDNQDAKTYNTFQAWASPYRTWRTSEAERLAAYPTQYAHAVVIDFNKPRGVRYDTGRGQTVADQPADTRLGSAIFLHASGAGSTAGCVSVGLPTMVRLLTWLDPAAKPRIVMAPAVAIRAA
ncbi:cell wall-binding protein [Actinoplanes utahensis]|uniref:Cell wall-binding protein n=1 Tax=Actinoplanes utahensis TaxID=1869 RepID=A0A0A6UHQ2_ACTUT|nr:cell wall-binding protein [Actinoplanes utahensis]